jgi:hypothetical protein
MMGRAPALAGRSFSIGERFGAAKRALGGVAMAQQMVWKCEQWLGGRVKEQSMFLKEETAREYVRRLAGVSPDLVFKIEPMPIQHVWN